MAMAKLNVLQLHMNDMGRFAWESKVFPVRALLSPSIFCVCVFFRPSHTRVCVRVPPLLRPQELNVGYDTDTRYWKQSEIRELLEYAKQRGVRLVPEIEMSTHAKALHPLVKTQGLEYCNRSFPIMLFDDPAGKTFTALKKLGTSSPAFSFTVDLPACLCACFRPLILAGVHAR